jgi:Tol biopolymer transport system component
MTRTTRFLVLAIALTVVSASLEAQPKYTIAYSGFAPLNTDIFIADADGSNPKPFLPGPALDFNASFSRDGKWILFTSDRNGSADIYRAHTDGTALERLTGDPSFDDQAALSPDGRTVAFVSTRSGHAEIWTLDLHTRKLRNITNHAGGHFRPTWSPDGQWIAISSDRDSPKPRRPDGFESIQQTEIYLLHPDGSGLRQLTHTASFAGSPSWSPDGRQIAFYKATFDDVIRISDPRHLRATTQIVVVDVASGMEKPLTQGSGEKWSPRWLPDGRIGYFSGGPDGGLEFTRGDAGLRGEFNSPDWSPDGRKMIYHRDIGQNWPPVVETPSKDPRFRLLRTGIFPSFSPSGDRLVFTNGQAALSHNGLLETNADGSNRWLIHDDLQRNTTAPVWSPKGDWIAFGLGGAFQGFLGTGRVNSTIALIRPDGSGLKEITHGERNDGFPSWSPDGKRVVFRTADQNGKGLRIVDIDTGQINVLTKGDHTDNFPDWSPSGDWICFTSNREDNDYEIYAIRPDGTGLKRLTHLPGNDAHSTWSPDGEWIAFSSGRAGFKDEMPLHPHNPQSYGEITVMRADGSQITALTDNPWEDATPRWAPLRTK